MDRNQTEANGVSDNNGRDNKTGRFLIGNPGGPGNPNASIARKIRSALDAATDTDKIQQIWRKAQDLALEGDTKMIIYVIDRVAGKPKESVELSGTVETSGEHRALALEFLEKRDALGLGEG